MMKSSIQLVPVSKKKQPAKARKRINLPNKSPTTSPLQNDLFLSSPSPSPVEINTMDPEIEILETKEKEPLTGPAMVQEENIHDYLVNIAAMYNIIMLYLNGRKQFQKYKNIKILLRAAWLTKLMNQMYDSLAKCGLTSREGLTSLSQEKFLTLKTTFNKITISEYIPPDSEEDLKKLPGLPELFDSWSFTPTGDWIEIRSLMEDFVGKKTLTSDFTSKCFYLDGHIEQYPEPQPNPFRSANSENRNSMLNLLKKENAQLRIEAEDNRRALYNITESYNKERAINSELRTRVEQLEKNLGNATKNLMTEQQLNAIKVEWIQQLDRGLDSRTSRGYNRDRHHFRGIDRSRSFSSDLKGFKRNRRN